MKTENLSTLKIHKLSQEQYDRELEAGRIDEGALYLTPEEEIDLSPYATIEQMNEKADKSEVVDIASEQTVSGVKTFSNGIKIGNATMSYDSENNRIVIAFPE